MYNHVRKNLAIIVLTLTLFSVFACFLPNQNQNEEFAITAPSKLLLLLLIGGIFIIPIDYFTSIINKGKTKNDATIIYFAFYFLFFYVLKLTPEIKQPLTLETTKILAVFFIFFVNPPIILLDFILNFFIYQNSQNPVVALEIPFLKLKK